MYHCMGELRGVDAYVRRHKMGSLLEVSVRNARMGEGQFLRFCVHTKWTIAPEGRDSSGSFLMVGYSNRLSGRSTLTMGQSGAPLRLWNFS